MFFSVDFNVEKDKNATGEKKKSLDCLMNETRIVDTFVLFNFVKIVLAVEWIVC